MIELSVLLRLGSMEHRRPGPGQVGATAPAPLVSPGSPPAPVPPPAPHGGLSGRVSDVDCSDPGSVLGELICMPSSPWAWMAALSGWLSRVLSAWWPLLTVGAAMALVGGALLAVVIGRARAVAAVRAVWVEITPPARVPVDGAPALWRALAGLLSRTRPRSARHRLVGVGWWVRRWMPRQLVVEFVATTAGVRVGVWVPPTVDADAVAALVARCWPGARATLTAPPTLTGPDRRPAAARLVGGVSAVHVAARGGTWAPLLDPSRAPRELRTGEVDPLHGVLETLADRRPGQTAVVQLVVAAHPDRRHPQRHRGVSGLVVAMLTGLLRLAAALLIEIVDITTHHGPRPSATTGPGHHPKAPPASEDPVEAARRRDLAAKQARGPHLRATLRLAVTTTGRGSRDDRAAAVVGLVNCYDQAAPAARLYTRPVRRAARAVAGRRAAPRAGLLLTVAEAAALWHLPADPGRYGIRDAPARVRRPRRDLPRLRPHHTDPYTDHGRTGHGSHDTTTDDRHRHSHDDGPAARVHLGLVGQAGPVPDRPFRTALNHWPDDRWDDDGWAGERRAGEHWSDGGHDAAA